MKNLSLFCCLGLLLCGACAESKEAFVPDDDTIVRFEDPFFEAECLAQCDRDGDGVLRVGEVSSVEWLAVDTRKIRSLGGIEYFVNLRQLSCEPIHADPAESGRLERLDVSRNGKLESLQCRKNRLGQLDVSRNKRLTDLWCSGNSLERLVLNNPELTLIDCASNRLSRLDIRSCSLQILMCDCAGNPPGMELRMLWNQTPILTIDPTRDIYDVQIDGDKILTFGDSEFERQLIAGSSETMYVGVDTDRDGKVSRHEAACVKTHDFVCDRIASFADMRYLCNLITCRLSVENRDACRLRTLDAGIYGHPRLLMLEVNDLPLTSLDVAKFETLEVLGITGTDIESLDVSGAANLKTLNCSNCPKLKEIRVLNQIQRDELDIRCDEHTEIKLKR